MWSGTENQVNEQGISVELTLIRHGMTNFNEERRYLGRTDAELSEAGRQALRKQRQESCCRISKETGPDLVFAGPMKRCRETAAILYGPEGILLIPEWTEIDFGVIEGKCYEELKDDKAYLEWLEGGCSGTVPGGESREDFIARSMQGYERMLRVLRERSRIAPGADRMLSVAAVVHGGTIMALGSSLFGGDYFDYQLSCGGEYQCPIIVI